MLSKQQQMRQNKLHPPSTLKDLAHKQIWDSMLREVKGQC